MEDLDEWLDLKLFSAVTMLPAHAADAPEPSKQLQQYPPMLQHAVNGAVYKDSTQNQHNYYQSQQTAPAGRLDGGSTGLLSAVDGLSTSRPAVLPQQLLQANLGQCLSHRLNTAVNPTVVGSSAAAETLGWHTAHHASCVPAAAVLPGGLTHPASTAAAKAAAGQAVAALAPQMNKRQRLHSNRQQKQDEPLEDQRSNRNHTPLIATAYAGVVPDPNTASQRCDTFPSVPEMHDFAPEGWIDGDWPGELRAEAVQQLPGIFQRTARSPTATDGPGNEPEQQQRQQQHAEAADEPTVDEINMLVSADFGLSREQVIDRIEHLVQQLVSSIAAGQLPELVCVSTAANNVVLAHPEAEQQDEDEEVEGQQQRVLRLGSKLQRKTLLGIGGQQAYTIARVLQLLDVVHGLLKQGRTATQRDIYYTVCQCLEPPLNGIECSGKLLNRLLSPPFFNCQRDLTSTIQTTLSLLRLPRSSLGITAASKGAVAGRLLLRCRAGEAWQDCSLTGSAGRTIPGEIAAIQAMSMRPAGARFILVVEKDAVFQRLVEDRLFDDLPCIIITGRGMPDIATRAFLAALAAVAGPSLPVLGLVDWNPAGVHILLSYKFGTAGMGLEAVRYAVPYLSWLGINADMLQDVPRSACQQLTQRDRALLANLKAKLADSCSDWVPELDEMQETGLKADIEALYGVLGHQGLAEVLSRRMLAQQYLG